MDHGKSTLCDRLLQTCGVFLSCELVAGFLCCFFPGSISLKKQTENKHKKYPAGVCSTTNQKSVLLVLMFLFFPTTWQDFMKVGSRWKCSLFACKFKCTLSLYLFVPYWRRSDQESGVPHFTSSIQQWSVLHVLQFLCCARFPALRALSTTGSSTKLKMGWSYGMLRRDTMLTTTCCAGGVDQNHLQAQRWVGLRQALEVNPASKISTERLFVNRIWWPDALGSDHTFGAWKMQDRPFWRDGEPFSMHLLTFR